MNCPHCKQKTSSEAKLCAHCGKTVEVQISTKRKLPIICPNCAARSDIINCSGLELDYCRICNSVWFDKREVEIFVKLISKPNKLQNIKSALFNLPTSNKYIRTKNYLKCPICKEVMYTRNFEEISGVLLDQCHNHGTYAEKDDLLKIFDLIESNEIYTIRKKASEKKRREVNNRIRDLEYNQEVLKSQISKTQRNQKAHLALDILGIL